MRDDPRKRAAQNLDAALQSDRRFPQNVFRGTWDVFAFFDPDVLFEPRFVERAQALLRCENGICVCLRNLGIQVSESAREHALIFFDSGTTGEAFMAQLRGPTVGSGWLYRMDRYACTSDIGRWCIYCERNNEIAVIATRGGGTSDGLRLAIEQFEALRINEAIEKPPTYGLSSKGLPAEWRERLLKEYGQHG